MSINLLETVQQHLGYGTLLKIDPNTQQVIKGENIPAEDRLGQAAIPAVLTGLYMYVQSDAGADDILQNDVPANLVSKIFNSNKHKAVQAVAAYGLVDIEQAERSMNAVAEEAVKLLKTQMADKADAKDIRAFLDGQRNNILLHLPSDMQIGAILGDNNLDDNTYKMDGGISGLIQNIGALFSTTGSDEDNSKK